MKGDRPLPQRDRSAEMPRHAFDARADLIRQTLDRVVDLGFSTLTARQALYDLELELWELRGGQPKRDD